MTWTDAAETILSKARAPLNYRTLASRIVKAKLVTTKTKTRHITLHASITQENKARQQRGIPARFVIEKGKVSLATWEQPRPQANLVQQTQKLREAAKNELLRKLIDLPGERFESYIEALLVKMGYQEVQLSGGPSDRGVDLLCEMTQGINEVKTAVQAKCKRPNRRVGPRDVRLLRDVLPTFGCSQGVLITTSKFTREAKDAADEQNRLPIILIDGDRLAELALEHEVGIRSRSVKTYSIDADFELFK